jgi:uncharacterized protein YraI
MEDDIMTPAKSIRRLGLAAAALLFTGTAASALEAAATAAVNVRSGPGTSFGVVDQLYPGEIVDVTECNAANTWCRIFHTGPDGWVSRSYLGAPPAGGSGSNVQLGITIPLPGGGSITFGTPGYSPPSPGPAPVPKRVCVYDFQNYGGASVCVNAGVSDPNVTGFWNNRVTSVRVFGGARIKLCQNPGYGGFCRTIVHNESLLGGALNNKASSYQTW